MTCGVNSHAPTFSPCPHPSLGASFPLRPSNTSSKLEDGDQAGEELGVLRVQLQSPPCGHRVPPQGAPWRILVSCFCNCQLPHGSCWCSWTRAWPWPLLQKSVGSSQLVQNLSCLFACCLLRRISVTPCCLGCETHPVRGDINPEEHSKESHQDD